MVKYVAINSKDIEIKKFKLLKFINMKSNSFNLYQITSTWLFNKNYHVFF